MSPGCSPDRPERQPIREDHSIRVMKRRQSGVAVDQTGHGDNQREFCDRPRIVEDTPLPVVPLSKLGVCMGGCGRFGSGSNHNRFEDRLSLDQGQIPLRG
jgi:hypothetical protein